jgi:hypothetical protein
MNNKCLGLYKSTLEKHFYHSIIFLKINGFFRRNIHLFTFEDWPGMDSD